MPQQEPITDWSFIGKRPAQAQGETDWSFIGRKSSAGPSAGTVAESFLSSLGAGAVGTAGAGLEGLGLVADKIEGYLPEFMQREGSPFRETGRSMQEYAGELGAGARRSVEAEGGATKFLGSTVPEALGSGVAFAGTALGTGLVGGAAAGVGAVALSGVSAGLSQGYNDAKAHGASEDDAWTSALINGGMGAGEAFPTGRIVGRLLRRMARPALEVVKTALLEGAEEASQEAVQGVVGNLVAKYWVGYDEDRKALEGVLEGGGAGAVTGVLMSLLGAGAGRALGPAKAKPGAVPTPVPTPVPTSVPTPTGQAPQAAPTGVTQPEQAAESSRPEAAPRTESSHALDILSRRVNQSAEELEASTGKPQPRTTVQEVVPATPEEQADIDFAADFGVRATLVRGDRGPLQFPGLHTEGEILLDQAAPSDTRRRMVLLHELGHELARVDPEGFEGLIEDATVLDPEGMADAQQGTARDWEAATGQEYDPDVSREEGMARRIETMGRWLDVQMRHPEHFAEVLLGDKTFMERFRDAVSRLLQRIGFEGLKSSQAVRLEKLVLELGQPTVKNDARSTIALARKVSQAFDILRGREVPPRKPAQQRAQPVPQGEASTPATTLAAQEQVLPTEAVPAAMREEYAKIGDTLDAAEAASEAQAIVKLPEKAPESKATESGKKPIGKRKGAPKEPGEGTDYGSLAQGLLLAVSEAKATQAEFLKTKGLTIETAREKSKPEQSALQAEYTKWLKANDKLGTDARFAVDAYHGTPHEFDEFKAEKIGTGEGAQAYGYGLYFTDKKEIAEHYRQRLSATKAGASDRVIVNGTKTLRDALYHELKGRRWADESHADATGAFMQAVARDTSDPVGTALSIINTDFAQADPESRAEIETRRRFIRDGAIMAVESMRGARIDVKRAGRTLKVTLAPDEDEFLLWDKPLSEQSEKVKAALENVYLQRGMPTDARGTPAYFARNPVGENLYVSLAGTAPGRKNDFEGQRYASELLRQLGVRGIKYLDQASRGKGTGTYNYVIFDAKDVRIDARFAVAPQDNVGPRGPLFSAVPRHTLFDEFVAYTQQYLRRTQTLAKDAGVKTSIVNAEESRPGVTADALRQFERRNIKPIRNILKEYEIENWEAGKYLLALHAPDGNALAAKRSPKKYGKESSPGTGMSNSEAAKIVAEYEADPKRGAGFKQLATINRRVGREKLSLLVSSGLLTQEAADQWREDLGPNYINLRNSEYDEFESAFGTSSRTGVRGKESKARQGRADRKSYASILPDTLAAAMEKIDRAAQNEVAKTVGQFVMELNRPEVAEVVAPDMETTEGEQPVARKPHVKPDETLYTYKEKGHEVHVVIRDQDFAEAITKAGVEYWPKWARVGVKAMDMWRKLQTTWNFSWFLSNFPADMQDALITINREGLVKTKRKILKNIGPALQATWASEHDTGKDTKLGKMLREGEEHGAFLGLAEIPTGAELTKRFSKLDSKDPVRAVLGWIEANSSVFEKGVRLAVYTAMRDLKVEPAEAARISRETTTPFVRHGNMTPLLSFLYAFFNARLQGAVIMAKTVSSKRGLKVLGGTMGLAFLVAMINRAIMGEDDEGRDNWDKVPQHRKMNYWALGLPNSETTVGPRMPRQFAWALSAAINLERLMFGSDYKAEDMVKDTLLSVINTASPIDASGSGWQAITFTLGDPVVQLLENRDFAGNWINPPDFPGDKRPASEKAMRNTPEWSKNAAKLLNWMSGGDEVVEGKVSIRPGTLDHAVKFLIGGAGQEGKRIFELPNKILSGEWTYNDIPIARKLMSGADKHYEQREFFQSVEAVEALTDSVEQYEKLGKKEEAAALRKEHPLEWAMRFRAAVARKKVTRIRDHMDAAGEGEKKKYQDMLDDVMVEYNRAVLAKERR